MKKRENTLYLDYKLVIWVLLHSIVSINILYRSKPKILVCLKYRTDINNELKLHIGSLSIMKKPVCQEFLQMVSKNPRW